MNKNNKNVLNGINGINNMNNKINNIHNMNNFNKINNIKIIDNSIKNMNNINNINNMNNINIINNNNNLMNQNNPNKISIKFNDQMNDDFAKKYNIHFKINNNEYIILVNGRTKIYYDTAPDIYKSQKGLINKFMEKMKENYVFPSHVLFLYNGINIKNYEISTKTVSEIFKNNRNPTIFVQGYNLICKLILVTFKINKGDKYEIIFNSNSVVRKLKDDFLEEIDFYIY